MLFISSEKPTAQNAMEIILLLLHNILLFFFKTKFNNEILQNVYTLNLELCSNYQNCFNYKSHHFSKILQIFIILIIIIYEQIIRIYLKQDKNMQRDKYSSEVVVILRHIIILTIFTRKMFFCSQQTKEKKRIVFQRIFVYLN